MPRRCGRQTTSQSPRGNAKTVLANFFVLSIFGQFDYELESRLLKSEKPLPCTASTAPCCRQINWWLCCCNIRGISGWHLFVIRGFRREVARWLTHHFTKRNDLPTTLCTTLDSVNPVLYPSIDTISIKLCVLFTMSVASATAERSFSTEVFEKLC